MRGTLLSSCVSFLFSSLSLHLSPTFYLFLSVLRARVPLPWASWREEERRWLPRVRFAVEETRNQLAGPPATTRGALSRGSQGGPCRLHESTRFWIGINLQRVAGRFPSPPPLFTRSVRVMWTPVSLSYSPLCNRWTAHTDATVSSKAQRRPGAKRNYYKW